MKAGLLIDQTDVPCRIGGEILRRRESENMRKVEWGYGTGLRERRGNVPFLELLSKLDSTSGWDSNNPFPHFQSPVYDLLEGWCILCPMYTFGTLLLVDVIYGLMYCDEYCRVLMNGRIEGIEASPNWMIVIIVISSSSSWLINRDWFLSIPLPYICSRVCIRYTDTRNECEKGER